MRILMSGTASKHLPYWPSPYLGGLVSPRARVDYTPFIENGIPFAADNDCFSTFNETKYWSMITSLVPVNDHCLFVTAPDVVGDSSATLASFHQWERSLHAMGLRVGLVAQDGLALSEVPWDLLECLFIGGSTEFKLSYAAAQLVWAAKARGKYVHMGRVNSMKRLRWAHSLGCDSIDGTQFSWFTRVKLPKALDVLASL